MDKPHNGLKSGAHVRPYQLPSELLEEVFTAKAYKRFTVVRDPGTRALSGYLEKIMQGLRQSEEISEALARVRPLTRFPSRSFSKSLLGSHLVTKIHTGADKVITLD